MTLNSRLLEAAKSLDAWAGVPLARRLGGARRVLRADVDNALLIRLWGLGNLTLLAPVLAANRSRRLRLLTLERNVRFVRYHFPHVELRTLPDPYHPRLASAAIATMAALHRDPPDVVVDLEPFLRLPLLLVRASCPTPVVGLDTDGQGRRPLLDLPVAGDPLRHVADTLGTLCRAAGLTAPAGPGGLRVDTSDRERAAGWLPTGNGPLVLLHPGTGDHAEGRRWPARRFGELAARLAERRPVRLAVTGTAGERGLVESVAAQARGAVCDLTGPLALGDPGLWAACLQAADLVVTNDTGPLHMADALGTATVALFGPNSPLRTGPRRPGSVALYADLPCSPCLDARTMKRTACQHFACMDALDIETVTAACTRVLDHEGSHGRSR